MRALLVSSVLLGCASIPSAPPQPVRLLPPQSTLAHGMRNCPSALVGATTRFIETKDGVDLEITANDPVVRRQIIALANVHAHLGQPNCAERPHTGLHGGTGTIGYCPIIHVGTRVTFRPRSNGAVIHVHALTPRAVPEIQKATALRVSLLAAGKPESDGGHPDRS
jgi:TusA-related sulfurtransferase